MGVAAVSLVIVAAFAHAAWNFFAKRAGSGGAVFVWLTATCSAVLYAPVAVVTVCWTGLPDWGVGLLGVLVSAAIHLGYYVLLQRGYAVGDMSVVYPLARGTGPLLAMVIALVLLGERPAALGAFGGLLVIAGVFVIGFSSGLPRSSGGAPAGWGFGLLPGFLIATYTVWDSRAVTVLGISPLLFEWASSAARSAMLGPHVARRPGRIAEVWSRNRREVLAVAMLSPLAYVLVLCAMRLAPVSLVAPARELSIVLAGLLAWRALGEPHPLRRLAGSAVILAGIVLLGVA